MEGRWKGVSGHLGRYVPLTSMTVGGACREGESGLDGPKKGIFSEYFRLNLCHIYWHVIE